METNKKEKKIIIALVLVILLLLIFVDKLSKDTTALYWVDDISLQGYTYTDEEKEIPKATLYFSLFSNKGNHKEKRLSIFEGISADNVLDADEYLYFKCHNKVTDEFYYIEAHNELDNYFGFQFGVLGYPSQDNKIDLGKNNVQVTNEDIINNVNNIDRCEFIGINK